MNIPSLVQGARGLWNRHIAGDSADYVARDSTVNRIRSADMGPLVGGVAAGTAVGAAGGFAAGVAELAKDQLGMQRQGYEALRPVLSGAHYVPESSTWNSTYDGSGNLTGGYWTYDGDYFQPIVREQSTGLQWSRQEFTHTMRFGPAQGALVGAGIGLGAGLVLGLGASLVASMREKDSWGQPAVPQAEWQKKVARAADQAPLTGLGVGAVAGGCAGFVAGQIAEHRDATLTQSWQEPVFSKQVIGFIPHASQRHHIPGSAWSGHDVDYSRLGAQFGEPPFRGAIPVERQVPTGEFQTHTATMHPYNLTPLTGALLGVGVGALSGVAAGVALGIIGKVIAGEDPPR